MTSQVPAGGTAGSRDPGLQPERTALAWQRTGASLAVAALVVVRQGLVTGGAGGLVVVTAGLAVLGCGLVVVRASRTELDARVRALERGTPMPAPRATGTAAAAVLLLVAATVGVLLT